MLALLFSVALSTTAALVPVLPEVTMVLPASRKPLACIFTSRDATATLSGRKDWPALQSCDLLSSQSPDLPLPHGLAPSETMV